MEKIIEHQLYDVKELDKVVTTTNGVIMKLMTKGIDKRSAYIPYGWCIQNNEYYFVEYSKETRTSISINVAKTLANTFIPNPNNYSYVNYIDGDNFNISIDNLEWVKDVDKSTFKNPKQLSVTDNHTGEIKYFINLKHVSEFLNTRPSTVLKRAKESLNKPFDNKYVIDIPNSYLNTMEEFPYTIYVYNHKDKTKDILRGYYLTSYHLGIDVMTIKGIFKESIVGYINGYTISKVGFQITSEEDIKNNTNVDLELDDTYYVECYDYFKKTTIRAKNEFELGLKLGIKTHKVEQAVIKLRKTRTISILRGKGIRTSDVNIDWVIGTSPTEIVLSTLGYDPNTKVYFIKDVNFKHLYYNSKKVAMFLNKPNLENELNNLAVGERVEYTTGYVTRLN